MVNKALKILCLSVLVLLPGIPSLAQNTKGDKPAPTPRETRFKTPKKSKQKNVSGRSVRQRDNKAGKRVAPPSNRTQGGDRPGKAIRPLISRTKASNQERPWKGDITGRRIRPKGTTRAAHVYPQPNTTNYSSRELRRSPGNNVNPNVERVRRMQQKGKEGEAHVGRPIRPVFHKTRPSQKERPWRGDLTGRRIRATPADKTYTRLVENHPRTARGGRGRVQRASVVPSSISGRARNTFAGRSFYLRNQSRKSPGMRATNRMALAMAPGPRQQQPRFESRKVVPRSASSAYLARRSTNLWAHFPRPKRKQEKAITTDLAGKKLHKKNYQTQRPVLTNPTLRYRKRIATGERPYKGPAGGYISRPRPGQRAWKGDIAHYRIRGGQSPRHGEKAFPGFLKGSGQGDKGAAGYPGNIKTSQRRGLSDQGEGYSGNVKAGKRGFRDQGEQYTGNIKAGKRGFRDQGEEYSGNIRAGKRGFRDQGEEYSGNIKTGRRGFRDQGEEYSGNIRTGRRGFRDQGEEYRGNTRVARRGFTDQGEEYTGNIKAGRKGFTDQGEEYTGNIKARRPDKGGGSVSGKLWNNNETPIPSKAYANEAYKITRFAGNIKAKRPEKGGGSISGKLWNNNERPIAVRTPKEEKGGDYSGYVKIARNHYSRNPNSADGALRGVKASAPAEKASTYSRGTRRDWDYIKNPSSDDEAQRTREPGRAFAQLAGYHGNIKVQKFDLSGKRGDLHPDARFIKLNKNNVPDEKDMFTNFKLWWARLFRKSETQPDHLKEKGRTPRYDKGESGLWYE